MGGWPQAHRRFELVHGVAGDVEREGVSALYRRMVEIVAEYGELGEFLLDVQRRYREGVHARLDQALEAGEADRGWATTRAVAEADRAYRALRSVLTACSDHPALAAGNARLARDVLAATGAEVDAHETKPEIQTV